MDNQSSPEFRAAAKSLRIISDLVSANQKEANRAERAIQTAKHHIVAARAGFHHDCSHMLLDRCLPQIEITLNTLHPFEYDPRISAYHGLYGRKFDFMRHPIAPVGSKVLTWDPPDKRGSWADHGSPRKLQRLGSRLPYGGSSRHTSLTTIFFSCRTRMCLFPPQGIALSLKPMAQTSLVVSS